MTDLTDKKLIESYDFADFLKAVVEATKDGWQLDLTTQGTYPAHIGALYRILLVKQQQVSTETTQEPVVAQSTTKRKTKGYSE